MPTALIAFDFDPVLRIGDGVIRLETIGIAVAIFAALIVAVIGVRTMDLRADDLLFVVLGVVPGAVVGGRLGYVLLHSAYFAASPGSILDPSIGSLELALAVVGGALTGGIVAALIEGDVGRWFHVATLPTVLVLGLGKLATFLGGRGQGAAWNGDWATAFLGPGPWGSLAPDLPSHASQVYEGIAALGILVLVMGLLAVPGARRPDGRAFLLAIALWAIARSLVAMTWRDPVVAGPFRAEQVIDLAIVLGCLIGLVGLIRRERPTSSVPARG